MSIVRPRRNSYVHRRWPTARFRSACSISSDPPSPLPQSNSRLRLASRPLQQAAYRSASDPQGLISERSHEPHAAAQQSPGEPRKECRVSSAAEMRRMYREWRRDRKEKKDSLKVKGLGVDLPEKSGGRGNVPLAKGKGLLDWVKLAEKSKDLAGTGGKLLKVTAEQLAEHSSRESCWLVLNGAVYNVTPYLDFHPGGVDEILRGVGKDATALFNDVHPWVNYESMLKACLVGRYVGGPPAEDPRGAMPSAAKASTSSSLASLGLRCAWRWEGGTATLLLSHKHAGPALLLAEAAFPSQLRLLLAGEKVGRTELLFDLPAKMRTETMRVDEKEGQIRVAFSTQAKSRNDLWASLEPSKAEALQRPVYRKAQLAKAEALTHDVRLLTLRLEKGSVFRVPVGHHVFLRRPVKGMSIARAYTPVMSAPGAPLNAGLCSEVHLLLKIYKDGALTPELEALAEGDEVDLSDPEGKFQTMWMGDARRLVLLAAGTGLTPMVRLFAFWAAHHGDSCPANLVLFNKTEADIAWREELEALKGLSVVHVLSQASASWKGCNGRISTPLLEELLAEEGASTYHAVCGPTPFTDLARGLLLERGVREDMLHCFKG